MTSISRPRQSILSLFDPLASTDPSTPPRNASPSADSDKENENPPKNHLTLTAFFNRTYKPVHPLPKPLRRRLIDVGDVTVDEENPWNSDEDSGSDELDMNDFEDNENDTLTFRQMAEAATPKFNPYKSPTIKTPSSSAPRTPLSELTPYHDTTPLARNRTLRNLPPSVRSKLYEVQSPEIVVSAASPQRRPAQDTSYPENHDRSAPLHEDDLGARASLNVAPNPLLNSVSSINLPSPSITGSLISETVIPIIFTPSTSVASICEPCLPSSFDNVRLRPNPPSTSSLDQSRCSVDLQSSFQFHFSDETHFDLLNDKVSFFNASKNGNSSYLDEDTSFDVSFGDSMPGYLEEMVQTPSATRETLSEPPSQSAETGPESKWEKFERSMCAAGRENKTPPVSSPDPSRGTSFSIHTEKPSSLEIVTPKQPKATQPVPPHVTALRIVKRSQLATQKLIASKATASPGKLVPRQNLAGLPKSPSNPIASKRDEVPPVPSCRAVVSSQSAANFSRPRIATLDAAKASLSRGTSSAPSSLSGNGPRRVLVSDESEARSTTLPTSRAPGGGNMTSLYSGPRRMMPASERALHIPKGSTSGARLKQPSSTRGIPRAPSRTTAGSSLPQPVPRTSRLPGPSVGVRLGGLPARDSTFGGIPTIRRA